MTRQEKIRDAASEYAGMGGLRALICAAFEAGADYADRHPKSPWVSVDDRLPDYRTGVLCHMDTWNVYVGLRVDLSGLGEGERGFQKRYVDRNGFPNNGLIGVDVDYWAPIPAPPEEGGGG